MFNVIVSIPDTLTDEMIDALTATAGSAMDLTRRQFGDEVIPAEYDKAIDAFSALKDEDSTREVSNDHVDYLCVGVYNRIDMAPAFGWPAIDRDVMEVIYLGAQILSQAQNEALDNV